MEGMKIKETKGRCRHGNVTVQTTKTKTITEGRCVWNRHVTSRRPILSITYGNLIYIAKMIFFVFVCLFLPHTNPHFWTKLCTHLPLRLEETLGYVCSNFLTFFVGSECRILGTTWLSAQRHVRHSVISVILVGVSVTSRCSRRHLPRVIRDSVISVIVAGVSVTSWKWRFCGRQLCAFLLEVSCTMGNA
jgi:hypothetical protein